VTTLTFAVYTALAMETLLMWIVDAGCMEACRFPGQNDRDVNTSGRGGAA
jgi:hypothetical protein